MTGLAPIDGLAVLAIVAKATGYGAGLLAMGAVLFTVLFRARAAPEVLHLARRIAIGAALVGMAVLALRFGIRAARISGMGFEGATDPLMLGFVWQSPLGVAAIWRGAGYAAIAGALLVRLGPWFAVPGALAVAVSFAFVGHSLGEPRAVLATLIVAHLLAAAIWVGALFPLRRAALSPLGADVLHHFGVVAVWVVAVLTIAGIVLAWLLSGSLAALFGTAYGAVLLFKVLAVSGLLGIAALNKLRLVPALRSGQVTAPTSLRRAITAELALVTLILLATATLTTLTTPPVNL